MSGKKYTIEQQAYVDAYKTVMQEYIEGKEITRERLMQIDLIGRNAFESEEARHAFAKTDSVLTVIDKHMNLNDQSPEARKAARKALEAADKADEKSSSGKYTVEQQVFVDAIKALIPALKEGKKPSEALFKALDPAARKAFASEEAAEAFLKGDKDLFVAVEYFRHLKPGEDIPADAEAKAAFDVAVANIEAADKADEKSSSGKKYTAEQQAFVDAVKARIPDLEAGKVPSSTQIQAIIDLMKKAFADGAALKAFLANEADLDAVITYNDELYSHAELTGMSEEDYIAKMQEISIKQFEAGRDPLPYMAFESAVAYRAKNVKAAKVAFDAAVANIEAADAANATSFIDKLKAFWNDYIVDTDKNGYWGRIIFSGSVAAVGAFVLTMGAVWVAGGAAAFPGFALTATLAALSPAAFAAVAGAVMAALAISVSLLVAGAYALYKGHHKLYDQSSEQQKDDKGELLFETYAEDVKDKTGKVIHKKGDDKLDDKDNRIPKIGAYAKLFAPIHKFFRQVSEAQYQKQMFVPKGAEGVEQPSNKYYLIKIAMIGGLVTLASFGVAMLATYIIGAGVGLVSALGLPLVPFAAVVGALVAAASLLATISAGGFFRVQEKVEQSYENSWQEMFGIQPTAEGTLGKGADKGVASEHIKAGASKEEVEGEEAGKAKTLTEEASTGGHGIHG